MQHEGQQEETARKPEVRKVETRVMVEGQIIAVSGWFPEHVKDHEAINHLRRKFVPQPRFLGEIT